LPERFGGTSDRPVSGGEKYHSDSAQTGREFLTLIVLSRLANMYGMSTDLTFITNESGHPG